MSVGRDRLDRRHRIHVVVREAIDSWNDRKQMLHMGHKIDLAAEVTEAIMTAVANGTSAQEQADG